MPLNLFFGVEDFRTIIHHQFDGKTGEQFDDIRLQCQWHITRSNLLDAVCRNPRVSAKSRSNRGSHKQLSADCHGVVINNHDLLPRVPIDAKNQSSNY